jgi:UDP-glucuronate decarboxylase
VIDLAEQIIELTHSQSSIVYKELPLDDPKQRRPCIAKARESLQWEPQISLEEGLKKTIAYFERCLQKTDAV